MQPFLTPLARLFSGSAELVDVTAAPVTAVPLSMACWFQPTSTTAGATQALMGVGDTSTTNRFMLFADGSGSDAVQAQTGSNAANTSTLFTAGRWHHACGVFTSATLRAAFLDGGGKGTNATSATPTGVNRTVIGARYNTTLGLKFTGQIMWPAFWNIALTDSDVERLAKGAHPTTVRPEALVAFWDWTGAESEFSLRGTYRLVNNATLPINGPAFLSQPVLPKRRRFNSVAAAAGSRLLNLRRRACA